jgi:hypothetical protein
LALLLLMVVPLQLVTAAAAVLQLVTAAAAVLQLQQHQQMLQRLLLLPMQLAGSRPLPQQLLLRLLLLPLLAVLALASC